MLAECKWISHMNAMKPVLHERRSFCPISTSLEIFGDRWSLLIVRDLLFFGARGFGDFLHFAESLAG